MLSFFYVLCNFTWKSSFGSLYENETSSLAIKNGEQAKVSD